MKRTFNIIVLITLLALTFGALGVSPAEAAPAAAIAQNPAYIHSISENAWGLTSNPDAMNTVFGAGNWADLAYETVTPAVLFSASYDFIFMDGSCGQEGVLAGFFSANQVLIETWVSNGGRLFLNSAGCSSSVSAGFGGVTLNFSDPGTFSPTATAVNPGHVIFNGPFTPAGSSYSGGYFAHDTITGGATTPLMTGIGGATVLAEMAWGNGWVIFGGVTAPFFWSPQPNGNNLYANILDYLANIVLTPSDTTDPIVTVPSDITAEATSSSGAVVTFVTSATDETSPANPAVTCVPASGSTFPLGTTPVTCSATDDAGNTGSASFNITVQDTTKPTDTVVTQFPPAITNSTSATFQFSGTDSVTAPGSMTYICVLDQGAWEDPCTNPRTFTNLGDGPHAVWFYSRDAAGNQDPATHRYDWLVDTLAPSFALVADNPYEATGPSGAIVNYNASFTDGGSGLASSSCSPASGSLFPLGDTTVNCTATDNAGNTSTPSFTITVSDTTAPTLSLPANISVPQSIPAGAVVSYSASATDAVGPASPVVSCVPVSGSTFPVGATTVNCSATDTAGNTANGSFQVTVGSGTQLLKNPGFENPAFPFPWKPIGISLPYTKVMDCGIFLSSQCSVHLKGSSRNVAQAGQQILVLSGKAGDKFSFGLWSRTLNVPAAGLLKVEVTFHNKLNRVIGTQTLNFNTGTHDFELASGTATAPADYYRVSFKFTFQKTSGEAWFDNAFLYRVP